MLSRIVRAPYLFLVSGVAYRVKLYVYVMCFFKRRGLIWACAFVANRLQRKYGIFISPSAEIKPNIKFPHPVGIVIGNGVKIGDDVVIYQHVTLGTSSRGVDSYPEVGDGCIIYAGAVIVGGVCVEKGAVVGANSVVNKDVFAGSVVAGIPARPLEKLRGQ